MIQNDLKRDYISILIIRSDIEKNGYTYLQAAKNKDLIECFRQLKNAFIFIPYSQLFGLLKCFSKYTIGDYNLSNKMRELRKKLDFVNHLRNKCSGHLDNDVLDKALQWEPSLFKKEHVVSEAHIFLVYKTLLESAINSYCDEYGVQKYFQEEIDLFYPPNWETFINFMAESQTASLDFLDQIKKIILPRLKLIETDEDLFLQAAIAAKTDFRLPKKKK